MCYALCIMCYALCVKYLTSQYINFSTSLTMKRLFMRFNLSTEACFFLEQCAFKTACLASFDDILLNLFSAIRSSEKKYAFLCFSQISSENK